MEEAKIKSSAVQRSFTRIFNGLQLIVQDHKPSQSQIEAMVADLELKFSALDLATESLYEKAEEGNADDDSACQHAETCYQEAMEKMNTARGHIQRPADVKNDAATSRLDDSLSASGADVADAITASVMLGTPSERQFNGDAREYSDFMFYIETHAETTLKSSMKQLDYLYKRCIGQPKDVVGTYLRMSRTNPDLAYAEAKAALKTNYGAPHIVVAAHCKDVIEGPALKAKDLDGLRDLSVKIKRCEVTFVDLGRASALESEEKLQRIYARLPNEVRNLWLKKLEILDSNDTVPAFSHMREILEKYVRMSDNEYFNGVASNSNAQNPTSTTPILRQQTI